MSAIMCTIEGVRTRASTQECLLTLSLPVEHAALLGRFLALVGTQIGVAFAVPGEKAEPDHIADTGKVIATELKGPYGQYIEALYKCGFFYNPKVKKVFESLGYTEFNNTIMHLIMRDEIGVNSLTWATPENIRSWADKYGILRELPLAFKE